MFANSRLAIGIAGGLVVGFLALFAIVGATIWLGERANSFFIASATQRDTRVAAVELRDSLRTAESSQRGFLLTGNEIYLAPYDTAKTRARQQLTDLAGLLANSPQHAPLRQRLGELVQQKFNEMDESIRLKGAGRDEQALAIIRTNQGKALMDELNVFLYGAILDADERSRDAGAEQQNNALMLRLVSIVAAIIIVLVVMGVALTVYRNSKEVERARDAVRAANLTLEERVKSRTADLALARERAEILLSEVNHRVANSLQLVAALVNMQAKTVTDAAAREALSETQSRIRAVSEVHKSLYTSGDVTSVSLHDYLGAMLANLEAAMRRDGHTATLKTDLEAVVLRTDESISLGVVATELVTNAFKYAYPPDRPGEIRVSLKRLPTGEAELVVQDDGVGLGNPVNKGGTGLGSKIIKAMAATLKTHVDYSDRQPGTMARLVFSAAQPSS